jgi:hypothetical protein
VGKKNDSMKTFSIIATLLIGLGVVGYLTMKNIRLTTGSGKTEGAQNSLQVAEAAELKGVLIEIKGLEQTLQAQTEQFSDSFKTLQWVAHSQMGENYQVGIIRGCESGQKGINFYESPTSEKLKPAIQAAEKKFEEQCTDLKTGFKAIGVTVSQNQSFIFSVDQNGVIQNE